MNAIWNGMIPGWSGNTYNPVPPT